MVFDFQKACCLKTPRAMPRCALGTATLRLGGNLRSETGARDTGLGSWPQMMVLKAAEIKVRKNLKRRRGGQTPSERGKCSHPAWDTGQRKCPSERRGKECNQMQNIECELRRGWPEFWCQLCCP